MNFIGALNERLGEGVRNAVLHDINQGQFSGPNRISRLARGIAVFVVSTSYLLGAAGLMMIVLGYPFVLWVALGVILICAAFYLRPRRLRNDLPTLRRQDAPLLFSVLDRIAQELNAPPITGVHVNGEYNAYMANFVGKDRIVGIGAPLWLALDPEERLALLAHEVAHLANNDPARMAWTGRAMDTLAGWLELFSPPALIDHDTNTAIVIDDRGFAGELIAGLFGGAFRGLTKAYETLIYADSQRAEYLADHLEALVAGTAATQSGLKKTILGPLAQDALSDTYYDGKTQVQLFEVMAKAVRNPDPDAAEVLYQEAIDALHSVDSSHPPTRYRMEVVGAFDHEKGRIQADSVDWAGIQNELAGMFSAQENKLLAAIMVQ